MKTIENGPERAEFVWWLGWTGYEPETAEAYGRMACDGEKQTAIVQKLVTEFWAWKQPRSIFGASGLPKVAPPMTFDKWFDGDKTRPKSPDSKFDRELARAAWNAAIARATALVEERFDECEPWLRPEHMAELEAPKPKRK